MADEMSLALSALERIASRDVGRGSAVLATHTVGALERAAVSIARAERPVVAILTGFFIPRATPPACETDGPVGALQIASAVHALGGAARILTDEPCAPVLRAGIAAAGLDLALDVAPLPSQVGIDAFNSWAQHLMRDYQAITHFIAIERPGPSASGPPRNMRGLDISSHTAPLEGCFEAGSWRKIAIGDGGNEIGMGTLPPEVVARAVPSGELIRCVVGCDDLLVGGTSNWAGAALVGGIALAATGGPARDILTLLDPAWSKNLVQAIVENGGAVDGVRLLPTATVDGLEWDDYESVLKDIEQVARSTIRES